MTISPKPSDRRGNFPQEELKEKVRELFEKVNFDHLG